MVISLAMLLLDLHYVFTMKIQCKQVVQETDGSNH